MRLLDVSFSSALYCLVVTGLILIIGYMQGKSFFYLLKTTFNR